MHLHTHVARAIRLTVSPETSPGSRQPRTQPLQYIRTRVCVPARVPRVVICALHVRVRGYARTPKRIAEFPGRGGERKKSKGRSPVPSGTTSIEPHTHIFPYTYFPFHSFLLLSFQSIRLRDNFPRGGWGQNSCPGLGSPIGTML